MSNGMIIILNGPLGIGKSTLAEALMEQIEGCVMLDGDYVIAMNPPPPDEIEYLNTMLSLLIEHHQGNGYKHFVINHIWRSPEELHDLQQKLRVIAPHSKLRCFLLTLSLKENLRRIQVRQGARALNESEFEMTTVMEERSLLQAGANGCLGELFDVSAEPEELVVSLLSRLNLTSITLDKS
jgi:hypothetical protein